MKPEMAIWAITPNGIRLGQEISARLDQPDFFIPEKEMGNLSLPDTLKIRTFSSLKGALTNAFNTYHSHVFIFSTGIAVRLIAPLLVSKLKDPAVVVMDEHGQHVISLISGHLGGANALAMKISQISHAVPVITTATDVNALPSLDMVAKESGLFIETPGAIKHANMKLLKGQPLSIIDPLDLVCPKLPDTLISKAKSASPDVVCTWEDIKVSRETLVLRPKTLIIGMGCNRNTPMADMMAFLKHTFESECLSLHSIRAMATTTVKADEVGMLELAKALNIPIHFYEKDQLNSVDTIETPSKMAEKYLGVKSVCEAAAILGANRGKLIMPKKKTRDVTLAVALVK
ncbi:MAG: cobalamin biosynthesis protein CbiG [Desulfobacterales bacterium]|nr:MAG: cobalamin biosynthesis protein CbiG [Desulfobacterales bacterium]